MKKLSIMALTLLCATRFDIIVSMEEEPMQESQAKQQVTESTAEAQNFMKYKQSEADIAQKQANLGNKKAPTATMDSSIRLTHQLYGDVSVAPISGKGGFDLTSSSVSAGKGKTIVTEHQTNANGVIIGSKTFTLQESTRIINGKTKQGPTTKTLTSVTEYNHIDSQGNRTEPSQVKDLSTMNSIKTYHVAEGTTPIFDDYGRPQEMQVSHITTIASSDKGVRGAIKIENIDPTNNNVKLVKGENVPGGFLAGKAVFKPEANQIASTTVIDSTNGKIVKTDNEALFAKPEPVKLAVVEEPSREVNAIAENIADQASRVQTPDDAQNLARNVVQQLVETSNVTVDPAQEKAAIEEASQNFTEATKSNLPKWVITIKEFLFGKSEVKQQRTANFVQPRTNNSINFTQPARQQ